MNIARDVAKVGGNGSFDRAAVNLVALDVDLLHDPNPPGNGNLVSDGRRLDDRAEFLRITADGILLILLEDRVELEIVDDSLDDQSAVLGSLDLIGFN